MNRCRSGKIYRKGYTRKSPSGNAPVKGTCIKSRSTSGKKRTDINTRIMKRIKSRQRSASKKTLRAKCPKDMIVRSAYKRRGYTKKSGAKVKSTIVAEGCIKDIGRKGKGENVIGPLMKGSLREFGYENVKDLSAVERRIALKKAIKAYGDVGVIKKLNAVSVLTTRTNSKLSNIYKSDMDWVMRNY